MTKLLLTTILFLSSLTLAISQTRMKTYCHAPKVTIRAVENDSLPSESYRIGVKFVFETYFKDTVSIYVDELCVAKKYLKSSSNGFAAAVDVRVHPSQEIVLKTDQGECTQFILKRGYKYLYIGRSDNNNWTLAYSNYLWGYY